MTQSLHLSETVDRPAGAVYAYAADPRNLPEWAAGLAAAIEQRDGQWVADSPMGRVVVEMAPTNEFGVLDHVVVLPDGTRVDNPMRVLPLGNGAEVVFTLRRRPGTTDDELARDADAVRADLRALKAVLEARAPQQFWDDLYGQRDRVWSGRVNEPLAREVEKMAPGRALDLGCGEGADALWLAERGWSVTAVDISRTALDRAAAEAQGRGLSVDWRQQDLADGLPPGPYDLVSAQFLQSPVDFPRSEVLRRAAAEVAPGGVLLVVGHAAGPPWSQHRHDPALTPPAAQVLDDLALSADWEVVKADDVVRRATGPDGQVADLLDSVVLVRRGWPA